MDDALHRSIAERIRTLAAQRGIAISHLGARAGVADAQVFRVLACTSSPTVAWLEKIAAALETTVADLVAPPPGS